MTVIARLRRWRGACSSVRCFESSSSCSAARAIGPFAGELSEKLCNKVHLRSNGFAVKTLDAYSGPGGGGAKAAGAYPSSSLPWLDVDALRTGVTNSIMVRRSPLGGRAHCPGPRIGVVDDSVEGLSPQPRHERGLDPRVGSHT